MSPQKDPMADPIHDLFEDYQQPLKSFFRPKSVAVIGATEAHGSVGRTLLWNLIASPFGGVVYPVNPKRQSVLGIKAYPSIHEVPERIDLALIVTPASSVPGIVEDCVKAKVKSLIVISAGFKEMGESGLELERQIKEKLGSSSTRLLGPNCLGLIHPNGGLNASFAKGMPKPGKVAFLSQSGALLTAVLDWGVQANVGFSALVSLGSMLDLGWAPLIDYFGSDPETDSILIYMETMGDARAFISAARKVSFHKPILVIKAGRTQQAAQAAASHTGSMTGSDEVLDEAFQRAGVLRVDSINELFSMAEVLAKQPLPSGNRLALVTNAGGPAVLATDALIRSGGQLASLEQETFKKLTEFLPPAWSRANPIDILGDADAIRYEKALKIAIEDPDNDAVLVILTPQDMTESTATAQALVQACRSKAAHLPAKPVLASWMGGVTVHEGFQFLKEQGIPTFSSPDAAARAFSYMCQWKRQRDGLLQTPEEIGSPFTEERRQKAQNLLDEVRQKGRRLLTETESKQLLSLYDIPTTPMEIAKTAQEAAEHAERMGYPVVLKLLSETLTHKTDVGGVQLNLIHAQAVKEAFELIQKNVLEKSGEGHFQGVTVQPMIRLKDAYELIVGSSVDPQVGPVLMFGSGGQLVEVYKDYSLALAPLNSVLTREWIEKTRIYQALCGVRGRAPAPLDELTAVLMRFSQMVTDLDSIAEIEINPLMISSEKMIALDARVNLVEDRAIPVSPAIRPYPQMYVFKENLEGLGKLQVRPIRPEDELSVAIFHHSLSDATIQRRFFRGVKLDERSAHERLARICYCDYSREIALVVETENPRLIVGIGRIRKSPHNSQVATFSLIVGDAWQKKGVGELILLKLIAVASLEKINVLQSVMQSDNVAMKKLCERLGFKVENAQEGFVKAFKELVL